jgi:signal transduction histidine kinase
VASQEDQGVGQRRDGDPKGRVRLQVALVVNLGLFALAVGVALMRLPSVGWDEIDLFVVLALFGVAGELLATSTVSRYWIVASSAPYALAICLLDTPLALVVGVLPLAIDGVRRRPGLGIIASNLANYGCCLVGGSLLFGWLTSQWGLEPVEPAFMLIALGAYIWVIAVGDVICAGYSLAQGLSLRQHGHLLLAPQLGAEIPSALLAAITAFAYGHAGTVALALLGLVQLTFQSFVKQLVLSQQRADDLERRNAEIAQLSASRGRLLEELLTAEEHERKRLAEALHDNALQNLLAARQDLVQLRSDRLRRTRTAVNATIDQLRQEIFELYPHVLDQVGLVPALQALAERHARAGGFSARVAADGDVSSDRDSLLFSLGRELLANAARHAEPSAVALLLRRSNGSILVEAHDDGRGFEPGRLNRIVCEGHIGLFSCRERIEAVGGSFEIQSRTGRGTTIRACVPVAADPAP